MSYFLLEAGRGGQPAPLGPGAAWHVKNTSKSVAARYRTPTHLQAPFGQALRPIKDPGTYCSVLRW